MKGHLILALLALMILASCAWIWVSLIRPNPKIVEQMPGGLVRLRLARLTEMIALLWPLVGRLLLALLGFDLPDYATYIALGLSSTSWLALKYWSPLGALWNDHDRAQYEVGRLQRLHAYNSRR
ncbi:hypothetical protein [Aquidulcibacter paucihalophilus]|uniref:hypothetical protein n=1 Tax=Aquidulcibacter paucihalophilus TaxID=1978549 RepID=UPI000A1989F6|nr:hypothetical protein [Aquidulcibacter paucihalophilus]